MHPVLQQHGSRRHGGRRNSAALSAVLIAGDRQMASLYEVTLADLLVRSCHQLVLLLIYMLRPNASWSSTPRLLLKKRMHGILVLSIYTAGLHKLFCCSVIRPFVTDCLKAHARNPKRCTSCVTHSGTPPVHARACTHQFELKRIGLVTKPSQPRSSLYRQSSCSYWPPATPNVPCPHASCRLLLAG